MTKRAALDGTVLGETTNERAARLAAILVANVLNIHAGWSYAGVVTDTTYRYCVVTDDRLTIARRAEATAFVRGALEMWRVM